MENLEVRKRMHTVGCLLIHGFGGNIDEVRPLANYLTGKGFRVECPSLKGHTGKRTDLRKSTYRDWIDSAQKGYDKLRKECEVLFLIGFSMGGLLAFQIASCNRADAIVTLNTPIYYWDLKRVFMNIINDIKERKPDNIRRYISSSKKLPFYALINFRLLLSRTKPLVKSVRCPILTVQALEDDTVRKSSAQYIYNNSGSQCKYIEFYENSGHLILWSKAADKVIEDICGFLEKTGASCDEGKEFIDGRNN